MTSPEIPARKGRWLLAIGYGLLAEIATIATIIVVVMLVKYVFARGYSDADYAAVSQAMAKGLGIWGGAVYTLTFARRLMSKVSSGFIAHGIVVALAAIALSVGGSIAGHQGLPAGYLIASALKIAAGVLAGFLYQRSQIGKRAV